jgi:antitoxin (DNA-binding transcriptional repressor) of toxin-antitoxin stability system
MTTRKVGVREFRKQISTFLESDRPVAVTRHGETVGVYVPTPRKDPAPARLAELKAAADRLAEELKGVDEEEFAAEFEQLRRAARRKARSK